MHNRGEHRDREVPSDQVLRARRFVAEGQQLGVHHRRARWRSEQHPAGRAGGDRRPHHRGARGELPEAGERAGGVPVGRAGAQQLPHPPAVHGRVQGQVQRHHLLPRRRRGVAPRARDRGRGRDRGLSERVRLLLDYYGEPNRHVVLLARVRDPSLHSGANNRPKLLERSRPKMKLSSRSDRPEPLLGMGEAVLST